MPIFLRFITAALVGFGPILVAGAQALPDVPASAPVAATGPASAASVDSDAAKPTAGAPDQALSGAAELLAFRASEVKFSLPDLMETLRDRRHEGWVLAAYPDPKTGRPLIGAGFSLDLPEREHAQTDPLNPHPFVEPSSAQLWAAAGLDPENLKTILSTFADERARWKPRVFRRKIAGLDPEITDAQADALLRIAAIQAIENARAYCRSFDAMTASQQMAMSQLVYQMGVNLEEFSQFLGLVNSGASAGGTEGAVSGDQPHWQAVQQSLIQSQWARLYRTRAIAVIAMLDPQYADMPNTAEQRIAATLRPALQHRRGRRGAPSLEVASYSKHGARPLRPANRRGAKKKA